MGLASLDGETDYTLYCFDQAVWYLGSYIQGELDAIPLGKGKNAEKTKSNKQERLLKKLLGLEGEDAPGRFRDPAEMAK